jgi:hypothetical protein
MWRRLLLLGTTVACLALAGPAALGQGARQVFGPWLGTYERSGSDAKSIIDEAIEEGTDALGPVKRKVAQRRLRAVNPPYALVRVYQVGDVLVTDFDGRKYSAPISGEAVEGIDPDGKAVTVSYRPEGKTLHARFVGEDGEKHIDLELDLEGDALTMHVTVLSKRLPEPIRYALPYARRR